MAHTFLGDIKNPLGFVRGSFREFNIGQEFSDAIGTCNKEDISKRSLCTSNVRGVYRYVEGGRLAEMGESIHNFMSKLDEDELEKFKENFKDSTKIANEFAIVEDLRKF